MGLETVDCEYFGLVLDNVCDWLMIQNRILDLKSGFLQVVLGGV